MTFNNATLESTCQTIVEAVTEDEELVPTNDEVERISVLAAAKPGAPTWAGKTSGGEDAGLTTTVFLYFFLAFSVFVLISVGILVYVTRKVLHASDKHAELHNSIMAMEENVQDLHINVQDLHLVTFSEHADDQDEDHHSPDRGVVPAHDEKGTWARKSRKFGSHTIEVLNRIRHRHDLPKRQSENVYQKTARSKENA
jgi:hypothetical protein